MEKIKNTIKLFFNRGERKEKNFKFSSEEKVKFNPQHILHLRRRWFTDDTTTGELTIANSMFYTLEDTCRNRDKNKNNLLEKNEKVYGKTAIPSGIYEIALNYSSTFNKFLPLLLNVPHFTGVRIHAGNFHKNTKGCILLGNRRGVDYVGESRAAMEKFMALLDPMIKDGKVFLDITGGYTAERHDTWG